MERLNATVTYSKDGHKKKQRRWFDGTLKFDLESRVATLFAEDGKFIASGTIPADVEIQDDSEEFILEAPSILVVISSITSGSDLPPPAAAPAPPVAKENTCQPIAHGGAALRRPFAVPLVCNTTAAPTVQQLDQPSLVRPLQPHAAAPRPVPQHRPPVKRAERTTADIMRLLSGKPIDNKKISSAPDPAAQTLNPLKRQRLVPFEEQQQQQQQQQRYSNGSSSGIPQQRPPQFLSRESAAAAVHKQMPPPQLQATSFAAAPSAAAAGRQWNPRLTSNITSDAVPAHSAGRVCSSRPPLGPPTLAAAIPGTVYFPKAEESGKPTRCVAVPDRFSNADGYCNAWEDSLYEEMTLKLAGVAKDFHAAAAGAGGKPVAGASSSSSAIEAAMRKARVPYYSTCELFIWKNYPGKNNSGANFAGGRKKKRKDDYHDDGETDTASGSETTKPENVYLILKSGRVINVDYSKGDLWILSNDPFMRSGFDPGQVGDGSRAPWVAVARSLWFGPNQDGKFEIEFLSSKPASIGRSTPVYAIKGPNASMELNILDLLKSPALATLPLLKSILGAVPLSVDAAALSTLRNSTEPPSEVVKVVEDKEEEKLEDDELSKTPAELAESVIQKFKLNAEQAIVVRHVATWANTNNKAAVLPPVCLIFGPFGCGKSSLLIAVLHLILKLRKKLAANGSANPLAESRVLVSAHTNVAVDRVLTGLLESGCSDFLRVGPLRRIDRKLLPYSLHASESKSHANAAAELKDMIREGEGKMSPTEEAALRAELAAALAGAERKRKKLLKTVPVVGVTCCSSLLPVLQDLNFDVVILDECSQIIEPLAMAPILRAKAKFLVAAGDPKQLPPVIAHPPLLSPPNKVGLLRPLFVRLSDLGATPHLLRQQYRCHPALSAIPNAQFYQGRLLDGVTAEQRPSLVPGLPPAVFIDVRDGREQYINRSTANTSEAYAVVRVVEKAIAAGVDPGKVGVICFYRAQVQEVQNKLFGRASALQAALENAKQQKQQHQQQENDEHSGGGGGTKKYMSPAFESSFTSIQVATVDAYQGAEKDLIILTTAATRPGSFIADASRLNVALTRARSNLVIVGCGQVLDCTAPAFAALIRAAKTTPGGYHIGNLN